MYSIFICYPNVCRIIFDNNNMIYLLYLNITIQYNTIVLKVNYSIIVLKKLFCFIIPVYQKFYIDLMY